MNTPSVEAFQSVAHDFCAIAECHDPLTRNDLWRLREMLVLLIFHFPAVESHAHGAGFNGRRIDDEQYKKAAKKFGQLPIHFYRVVYDPHDLEATDEPVTGMLADDLADIYRDLAEGLDNVKNGHIMRPVSIGISVICRIGRGTL